MSKIRRIQFPAQLYIFFPERTVRYLLRPVSRERPGQDLHRRALGRNSWGLWAERIQKRP